MKRVALTAILNQPAEFASSVVQKFFVFWITTHVKDRGQERYDRRDTSFVGLLKGAYRYFAMRLQPVVNGFLGIVILTGSGCLIARHDTRAAGLTLLATFLYFGLVTAIAGQPSYRYRMVLEPVMIATAIAGLFPLFTLRRHFPPSDA